MPQRLIAALGVTGVFAVSGFHLIPAVLIICVFSHGAYGACLLGLGPNWEDIEAEKSDPVAEVADLLKDRGELRSDEIERWYRDKIAALGFCSRTCASWE